MRSLNSPYVYQLIDPRNGRPFYVGKGRGKRAWAHERAVRRGVVFNEAKTARIKEIISDGNSIEVRIIARYASDDEALEAEMALIAQIGRENLTNATDGGEDGHSHIGFSGGRKYWEGLFIQALKRRWSVGPNPGPVQEPISAELAREAVYALWRVYHLAWGIIGRERAEKLWRSALMPPKMVTNATN